MLKSAPAFTVFVRVGEVLGMTVGLPDVRSPAALSQVAILAVRQAVMVAVFATELVSPVGLKLKSIFASVRVAVLLLAYAVLEVQFSVTGLLADTVNGRVWAGL